MHQPKPSEMLVVTKRQSCETLGWIDYLALFVNLMSNQWNIIWESEQRIYVSQDASPIELLRRAKNVFFENSEHSM